MDHKTRGKASVRMVKKWFEANRVAASLSALLVVLILIEASYLFNSKQGLGEIAQSILKACEAESYKPGCYDEKIPETMDEVSMEEAFEITKIVQSKDASYRYCHVLGHKLAARETAKDPSLWTDVMGRCPSGVCSNGCVHGAFQERFRRESLSGEEIEAYKPQFSTVCEPRKGFNPTGLEKATCYHALGHLFMYITSADVKVSNALCKELAVKRGADHSQLCFDGAFMQIFQPLEPDDFALIEGKEVGLSEVEDFCGKYAGKERGSCWSESWPLFREKIEKPGGISAHCSILKEPVERNRCFSALMYVVTAQMNFDTDKLAAFCATFTSDDAARCLAQAASRMVETDYKNGPLALELCAKGASSDPNERCFSELSKFASYNFHVGSDEHRAFCEAMPLSWKEKCFR